MLRFHGDENTNRKCTAVLGSSGRTTKSGEEAEAAQDQDQARDHSEPGPGAGGFGFGLLRRGLLRRLRLAHFTLLQLLLQVVLGGLTGSELALGRFGLGLGGVSEAEAGLGLVLGLGQVQLQRVDLVFLEGQLRGQVGLNLLQSVHHLLQSADVGHQDHVVLPALLQRGVGGVESLVGRDDGRPQLLLILPLVVEHLLQRLLVLLAHDLRPLVLHRQVFELGAALGGALKIRCRGPNHDGDEGAHEPQGEQRHQHLLALPRRLRLRHGVGNGRSNIHQKSNIEQGIFQTQVKKCLNMTIFINNVQNV